MSLAELKPKQRRFIEEYPKDLNSAAAARRSGYSKHSSARIGMRLLDTPTIRDELNKIIAIRTQVNEVEVDRILQEYKAIGFSSALDFITVDKRGRIKIDLKDLTPEQAAVIKEVKLDEDGKLEIKLHDKLNALQNMGRYLGMFIDRVETDNTSELAERLDRAQKRRTAIPEKKKKKKKGRKS